MNKRRPRITDAREPHSLSPRRDTLNPKVFIIVLPHLPFPADNGAKQRSRLLLQALAGIGTVHLLVLTSPQSIKKSDLEEVEVLAKSITFAPSSKPPGRWASSIPGLRTLAATHRRYAPDTSASEGLAKLVSADRPQLIVFRYAQTASRAGAERFRHYVIDADDHDLRVIMSEMRTTRNPARIALKAIQLAMTAVPWHRIAVPAQAITFASRKDARDGTREFCIPNTFQISDDYAYRPSTGKQVLFVGDLRYTPNVEGLRWFVHSVWPRVIRQFPEAELHAVGNVPDSAKHYVGSAVGVTFAGYVEDVEAEYLNAALTVAPIRTGGGTKIKVLESLAHGRVCVVAGHVARGFAGSLDETMGMITGKGAKDLARRLIETIAHSDLRHARETQGLRVVPSLYGRAAVIDTIQSIIESALASSECGHVHMGECP